MPFTVGKYPVPFPYITNQVSCSNPQVRTIQTYPDHDVPNLNFGPHTRLFLLPTESSIARKRGNTYTNICAPKDSLDLALAACYDQHNQWWAPTAATKMQCPTHRISPRGISHRLSTFRSFVSPAVVDSGIQHRRESKDFEPYRNCSSHVNCQISGSHASTSARGFGRGIDGLFYNS